MATRSCRVTFRDMNRVSHTVQVTASTLYEAVALGLASIHGEAWVSVIAEGLNVVRFSCRPRPLRTCRPHSGFHAKDIQKRPS